MLARLRVRVRVHVHVHVHVHVRVRVRVRVRVLDESMFVCHDIVVIICSMCERLCIWSKGLII